MFSRKKWRFSCFKKTLKGVILLLFDHPNDHPTDHPTCKMALFEPPFFVAIQELAGIFLAVQTSQNAHRLNAIKQPFEHRLTALFTPPAASCHFRDIRQMPAAPVFQLSCRPIYPLFRVFRPSFHVLLTPTLPLCHFLAHIVAFRPFSCTLTHRPPFRALYAIIFPFPVPALPSGHKKSDRRSAILAPSSRHYFDFRPSAIKPNSTPSRSILTLH